MCEILEFVTTLRDVLPNRVNHETCTKTELSHILCSVDGIVGTCIERFRDAGLIAAVESKEEG